MNLTFVGLGIHGAEQLTLEGLTAIKKAHKVLALPIDEDATIQRLHELGVSDIQNIKFLYKNGYHDNEIYKGIFVEILKNLKVYKNLVVLLPGHPRIGVSIVQIFEHAKDRFGIELKCIVGISSFATMVNDLAIDPLERGTILIDANRMLYRELKINPQLDLIIYHVCSVANSNTDYQDPSLANRLDLLRQYLLRFYPAGHEVKLISSNSFVEGSAPQIAISTIHNLMDLNKQIHFGTSLFIMGID